MSPRVPFLILTLASTAGLCSAAIWESTGWAVTTDSTGTLGYSTNIEATKDGKSSGFGTGQVEGTLARKNSSIQFNVIGTVSRTEYTDKTTSGETGGGFEISINQQRDEDENPDRSLRLSWDRSTIVDTAVGTREDVNSYIGRVGAKLFRVGKIGVSGQLNFYRFAYVSSLLSTSDDYRGNVSFNYAIDPKKSISIQIEPGLGSSTPNYVAVNQKVDSKDISASVRVSGQLYAKLKGFVYAGYKAVKYTGSYKRTDSMPIYGTGLEWAVTPSGVVSLTSETGVTFSSGGQIFDFTRATLSYSQTLFQFWVVQANVGGGLGEYKRDVKVRNSDNLSGGLSLTYQLSRRFSWTASFEHDTHYSSDSRFEFTRDFVSTSATLHF